METASLLEHRAALCTLIEEIRLIESITSIDNENVVTRIIAKALTHLPKAMPISDITINVIVSRKSQWKLFASNEYSALLDEIIRLFNAQWPLNLSRPDACANVLQIFGINYTGDFVRAALANLLVKRSPVQFNVSIQILCDLLRDQRWLLAAFVDFSYSNIDMPYDQFEQFVQELVTIPNRFANHSSAECGMCPLPFESSEQLASLLVLEMLRAIDVINSLAASDQSNIDDGDFNPVFLGYLLGRITIDFNNNKQSRTVTNAFHLLALTSEENACANIVQKIMWNIPRDSLHIVAWYALRTNKPSILLGDACAKSADWKFILQTKYPLSAIVQHDMFLHNLVEFLTEMTIADDKIGVFEDVLKAWSSKASITSQSFEQHLYQTKFLILAVDKFGIVANRSSTERCELLIRNGVMHHIRTLDPMTRAIGMITAEIILNKLAGARNVENQLHFCFDDFPQDVLKIVHKIRTFNEQSLEIDKKHATMKELVFDLCDVISGSQLEVPLQQPKKVDVSLKTEAVDIIHSKPNEILDSDDDDDDDLQPYDMSNDVNVAEEKMPKYLRDVCEALANTEDPDIFVQCVKTCASLVEQQLPHDITDVGIHLLSILIKLEPRHHMDNFAMHRLAACIAVCCAIPKKAAEFLCGQFHAPPGEYSVTHKILMLDILGDSAKSLAQWSDNKPADKMTAITSAPMKKLVTRNDENHERALEARRIIAERIEMKTNRFAHRSVDIIKNSRPNQFANVAGHFFFPLVHGTNDNTALLFKEMKKEQQDFDDILLYHFLNTVTSIMYAAQNSPIIRRMTPEVFQMSAMLRFHTQTKIRLASLQMIGVALFVTPKSLLKTQFIHHINELQLWLEGNLSSNIVKSERSLPCRDMAKNILALIYDLSNDDT